MKRNENFLKYVEKYKYKYSIAYATEGGKLVKALGILTGIVWCYSFFVLALSILSFALNFNAGVLRFDQLGEPFITTIVCAVAMIVAAAFFVCHKKIIGSIIAICSQPFIVLTYRVLNTYGMGYKPKYYIAYLVPAVVLCLLCAILIFVLVRAKIKTNKLYDRLVDSLYRQYGSKDGKKLSEAEWDEFLTNYNSDKKID